MQKVTKNTIGYFLSSYPLCIIILFGHYLWYWFTDGVDYECGSHGYMQVIFSTNSTAKSFNISIKENDMTEGEKKFNVTIIRESLQYNVNVGEIQTAIVNINDSKYQLNFYSSTL